jgi:hypothetical protein
MATPVTMDNVWASSTPGEFLPEDLEPPDSAAPASIWKTVNAHRRRTVATGKLFFMTSQVGVFQPDVKRVCKHFKIRGRDTPLLTRKGTPFLCGSLIELHPP